MPPRLSKTKKTNEIRDYRFGHDRPVSRKSDRGYAWIRAGSIYSRNAASSRAIGEEFGCQAFDDLDAFLADPKLEIVTIATPSGAHLEPSVAAARAGKHVICEKPLEITTDRVDQMAAVGKECGVTISGIFNRRFNPGLVALKRAVDEGRFGQISLADAYIKWYRDQECYDSGQWRGTWELDGGGALMNQSIHAIDQLLFVAGPIKSVVATTATLAHEHIEVEDTAVALLEFASGAKGVIGGPPLAGPGMGTLLRSRFAVTAVQHFWPTTSLDLGIQRRGTRR